MKQHHGISKSKYTLYKQCPKLLWLNNYKPENACIDDNTKARFEAGTMVGILAQQLFGNYSNATVLYDNGNLNLQAMTEKTKRLMDDPKTEVICEAAFILDSNYCAVDILRRTRDGWAIYEVKSSSALGNACQEPQKKYIPDITYQKWLLTKCGIKIDGAFLVCLNSAYIRGDQLIISDLFTCIQMDDEISEELISIEDNIHMMQDALNEDEPDTDIGLQCTKPYPCAFWNYCKRLHHIPDPDTNCNQPRIRSIFELHGSYLYFKDKIKLYKEGIVSLHDLKGIKLKKQNQIQIECTLMNCEHIDQSGIKRFLDTLSYPLYFLDFETIQPVIPLYKGTKPYQQIAFQYSLHFIEKEGGELKHTDFLAETDSIDPRRLLAEKLCKDIPMDTCVVAYNKTFECGRIKEMAEAFPDLSQHLMNIQNNIKDLWDPFKNWMYYTPSMRGSFSIKSVLPALYPDDPSLNYHNLDESVQNGGNAMTIFPLIKNMPSEQALKTRRALLEYCKLDTYAMVKVWEKLRLIVK